MNTNSLKKFAQEARKKLIAQVGSRLEYVLRADSAELRERAAQVKKLNDEIARTSREQLIEKVAYTWFNRLMALRFMDSNDYQPIGIRVVTPRDGFTTPEILEEAKSGQLPAELPVNTSRIHELLDGKIPSANPQNEVYKLLLIAACNHLHQALPFLFERIDDYTDLLIPDDLTSEFSIVHDVCAGMKAEDCAEVEIIGWLYQFYISEKKDDVFASKAAVKKEDIPAATQLFTPRWIVEYMVQNTVGKLWLQNHPASRLQEHMPYYIESPSSKADDFLKITSVEEIKLLDQACGSGHILIYGFELFYKIYEEEGYNPSEIPRLIIEKNLFGFEIDERAAQLASMALMMKARSYYRRLFRNDLIPNILCYQDLTLSKAQIEDTFAQLGLQLTVELSHDLTNMAQATNLGSLIQPHTAQPELNALLKSLTKSAKTWDVLLSPNVEQLTGTVKQLLLLGDKYHCVVDNPPYMGGGKMNKELGDWVKTNYPKSKADLMVCFMEQALRQLQPNGFVGMINLPSWMFISSFEEFRESLIDDATIDTLLHLGRGIFGSDFGSVAFTLINKESKNTKGTYRRLFEEHVQVRSVEKIRQLFLDKAYGYFESDQKEFEKIPGSPIGYWLSNNQLGAFANNKKIAHYADIKVGLQTGDNTRFTRQWSEISVISQGHKWIPYNKGGDFRKWYGNQELVVLWDNNGAEIRNFKDQAGKLRSRPQNAQFYFKESISWSFVSSGSFAVRYYPNGFIFDVAGSCLFPQNNQTEILGFLNSNVCAELIKILAPTINFQAGDIKALPYKSVNSRSINELIENCVAISQIDWDRSEISWNFSKNHFLKMSSPDVEESYDLYQQYWTNKFFQLHKNEEELNRQFIEIYGLEGEMTPDVPLDEITILQQETKIANGQLVFNQQEVFAQFVSYAVGCMFGRYSLDQEGLILANQYESLEDFLNKVQKSEAELSFVPDADNVIPLLDEEWFEDDIVGRFYAFLKATFGLPNFAKNLAFVEASLGKDIRKYFVKDFYSDHIQRYKKRPIYWMFSSPNGSFNVLIYMHRYRRDTLSTILNNYLNQYREKLRGRLAHLEHLIVSGSSVEQNKATRESDKIKLVLLELQEYERDILYPLASERIGFDLDDGVLVNYNKFGKAIKEVKGLNDKVTKQKVREFDWIDTTQIR
ncbi:hypothetical protein GCM10007423_29370 [Dyadobacter endophyticus]|uniref:site-specific DNA-methyltransferase (adenine-specific) n=1 Tax=Dyadobacter endophyticus TaxID=1749036 RepID=A0ABQ1YU92_9BACT|nr:BREX-1 system adenine-specific DNA-methyltransferase PglX [Dyadobacter endophyticus]GGH36811.1 hypothetical protein GCM10007423_29370 [Dyadobacter endophyticus]